MSDSWGSLVFLYIGTRHLPTERICHVTAGVAKHANTSSVPLKWVTWGLATAWPRHWPHIRTCPLWVLAADVWLVWHAATSTILVATIEFKLRSAAKVLSCRLCVDICHEGRCHVALGGRKVSGLFLGWGKNKILTSPCPCLFEWEELGYSYCLFPTARTSWHPRRKPTPRL